VDWLNGLTPLTVQLAMEGAAMRSGACYVAPDGKHLAVTSDGTLELPEEPPTNGLRPSVSFLFNSVKAAYGNRAVGVLLTGMGRDGADGLLEMRRAGALTIAQDEETSIVHGMPGAAVRLGAARYVLPVERVAPTLKELLRQQTGEHADRAGGRGGPGRRSE
jgi:two-component system chemotaxis response regulator CheB